MGIYRIRIIDRATGHPWGQCRYTDLQEAKEAIRRAEERGGADMRLQPRGVHLLPKADEVEMEEILPKKQQKEPQVHYRL